MFSANRSSQFKQMPEKAQLIEMLSMSIVLSNQVHDNSYKTDSGDMGGRWGEIFLALA